MTDTAPSTGRLPAILVLIATVGTIGVNFLAALGQINGTTAAEISARYPTAVTPAGYAFSIWSLIYAALLAFSVYQLMPSNLAKFQRIRAFYVLSCLLNCGWLYFWNSDQIGVCFVLILLLAITLAFINSDLQKTDSPGEYWLVKAPFSIYFGWVTTAALVNFAVLLVYLQIGFSDETWTMIAVILIVLATAIAVSVRSKLSNYLFPLAVGWALTAIAVKQSGRTSVVTACALGVVTCLIATLSFVVNLPSRPATRPSTP
jgi:translocator protein